MSAAAAAAAPALFSRSLALVEAWIAEVAPKPAPKPAAPAAAAGAKPAKGEKKAGKGGAQPAAAEDTRTSMAKVALRVGKVLDVSAHPDSDKLYVEQIDLGEEKPRTIISGLRDYISVEEFTGRFVVVAANLEPRKMRGILSEGMVLCAATEGKGEVKLLDAPPAVKPGERITFPGHDGDAEPVLKKKLAKCWDDVAPELRVVDGVATYGGLPFNTSAGPVTCKDIPNGPIS